MRPRTLSERFWEKVERRGPTECWPWRGAIGNSMTPVIYVHPRTTRSARRVALDEAGRPPDRSLFVRPTCGVDLCVNPDHLSAGRAPRPSWW